MIYLDTSLLVALLCREPRSIELLDWFATYEKHGFSVSHWNNVEFSSALSIKIRTGQISETQASMAQAELTTLLNNSFNVLPITELDYAKASEFSGVWKLGLRAPDALHLAIAQRFGVSFATLDRQQFLSAQHFGIPALIP
ncbi:type II toxin-antitoxin system VapC family toxin [Blastomonas sp.]|uniref:type II toxin-antitoxin system VapC family toxin n=1 Tax=Blastomonas sp. TaxID=1909299 RepID=UPI0035938F83